MIALRGPEYPDPMKDYLRDTGNEPALLRSAGDE